MNFGIIDYKDLAEFISYVITSFSLIGIWLAYALSKKQIHFSTMEKCLNNFREILYSNDKSSDRLAYEYIDLVNEELFYLEKNYLPLDVCIEWIDGMIDFLPFVNFDKGFVKSDVITAFKDEKSAMNLMSDYPRILKVIHLNQPINFEKVKLRPSDQENRKIQYDERNKIILSVISNLKISPWRKIFLKRKIASR